MYAKMDEDIRRIVLNKPQQIGGSKTMTFKEIRYNGAVDRLRRKFGGLEEEIPNKSERMSTEEMKRWVQSGR
jgi:hypothetical protein